MATAGTVHEFCIGRMVSKIGLLRVSVAPDFLAATLRIQELTKSRPGDYVVFDRQTGRVVAKVKTGSDVSQNKNPSTKRESGQRMQAAVK